MQKRECDTNQAVRASHRLDSTYEPLATARSEAGSSNSATTRMNHLSTVSLPAPIFTHAFATTDQLSDFDLLSRYPCNRVAKPLYSA
jgi:hypothetical protein